MKSTIIALCLSSFFLLSARAEMQFPDFAKLSPEDQKASGYAVNITRGADPSLHITVSPTAAAKTRQGARLYILDEQQRPLAEINAGLTRLADGSLSILIDLFKGFRGSAELLIYCDSEEGARFVGGNFGGFTFRLSSPQP